MLSVFMLSAIILTVIMLNVIMLSVVASFKISSTFQSHYKGAFQEPTANTKKTKLELSTTI
jgi:hypothetical protein